MSNKKLDPAVLAQFTGSEHWYRHGLVREILFTDGAKYVADPGGAYWLIDEIAIAQRFEKRVAAEEFQVWKLTVNPDRTRKARLRGRQRPYRLREGDPLHRLPGRRHRALVREQHDLPAERALSAAKPRGQHHHRCHKHPAGGIAPPGPVRAQDSRLIGPSEERERAEAGELRSGKGTRALRRTLPRTA